jgi:hypothetical protein
VPRLAPRPRLACLSRPVPFACRAAVAPLKRSRTPFAYRAAVAPLKHGRRAFALKVSWGEVQRAGSKPGPRARMSLLSGEEIAPRPALRPWLAILSRPVPIA